MQDKAIIKVKVTEENGEVTYGTAYRLDHKNAITALHVIKNYQSIEFIFPDECQTEEFTLTYENEDFDIGLVSFPDDFLNSLKKISKTSIAEAKVHDLWNGAGYPKFAENGKNRVREDVKGSCNHCPEENKFYDVSCDKQPKLKEWGGISGAPVFNEEKKLIGVICYADGVLDNSHFGVSAIWKLLQDEDFLKYFVDSDIPRRIKNKLLKFLTSDPDLVGELAEIGDTEESIINQLSTMTLSDALSRLEHIKEKLNSERQQSLSQFALQLLPYYFIDHAVVIDEALLAQPDSAVDIECVGEVAAECCLASFNGRKAHIERIPGSTEYDGDLRVTKGKFALAPHMGINQTKAEIEAMTSQILSSHALDVVLLERFAKGRIKPENRVNLMLKKAKSKGDSFYLVVRLGDKSRSEYQEKMKKIREYRTQYPDLIIVNLSLDEKLEEKEEEALITLPFIVV